jgi:hypothetical protein
MDPQQHSRGQTVVERLATVLLENIFGSKEVSGEWAKFEEEDEHMLEQMRIKEKEQCRDFD